MPLRAALRTLLLLLVLVVPLAVAAAQGAAPGTSAAESAQEPAARRAASVPIEIGDRVLVRVWREPGFSDSMTVDDAGEIVLPRLGPTRVAGHSIESLQDSLRVRYAEYLRNPSVQVVVLRRIGVQGEVNKPSLYFVDVTMTLREVLALAGGITEKGNPNSVVIVRQGREISLGKWQRGGPIATELQSGDQIVVGTRSWLSRNALAAVSTAGLVLSVLLPVLRDK